MRVYTIAKHFLLLNYIAMYLEQYGRGVILIIKKNVELQHVKIYNVCLISKKMLLMFKYNSRILLIII